MIPYDQLVAALSSWRQRNGLPTAAADLFGESPGLPLGDLVGHQAEVVEMADDAILADDSIDGGDGGDATYDPEATSIGEIPAAPGEDSYDGALLESVDDTSDEPR